MHQVPNVLSKTSCIKLSWLVERHLQKTPQSYLGMIWSTAFHSLLFTVKEIAVHLQLCSPTNYWSCLNKLHSSIWTLTCVLLVCLVKLPHNWPSRVGSCKQTLTAECVFGSAFTQTQILCILEEQTLSAVPRHSAHQLRFSKAQLEKGSKKSHRIQGWFVVVWFWF